MIRSYHILYDTGRSHVYTPAIIWDHETLHDVVQKIINDSTAVGQNVVEIRLILWRIENGI